MAAALLLSTTACDKGDAAKGDAAKADDAKAIAAKADDAAETGTEVAVDPAAATATAGAPADEVEDETDKQAETGEPAPAAGETPPDDDDGDDDDDDDDDKPAPTTKTTTPKKAEPAKPAEPIAKLDAKPLYEQKCKSCHGSDGKGDTTIGKKVDIPSLSKTKLAKAKIVSTIEKGVPDTKMKGYKGKLTDAEIDAIAGYVLKL